MSRYLSILCAVVVCGCVRPPLPNDEIIAEAQKCKSAGMDYRLVSSLSSQDRVYAVECSYPRKDLDPGVER